MGSQSDMTERLTPLPPPHGYFGVLSHTLFPLHISTRTTINIYLYVSLTVKDKYIHVVFELEGNGTPLQYSCLEKSHGRRSLVGCHLSGCTESDTTEAT